MLFTAEQSHADLNSSLLPSVEITGVRPDWAFLDVCCIPEQGTTFSCSWQEPSRKFHHYRLNPYVELLATNVTVFGYGSLMTYPKVMRLEGWVPKAGVLVPL